MLITTLDNEKVKWNPKGSVRANASEGHIQSKSLLLDKWPTVRILEEVPIPVRRGKTLYLDIFCPTLNLAIEFHGEQHFKFTPRFHKGMSDFIQARKNDQDKKDWCELNGINFIELDYKDDIDSMKAKLDEY